VKPGEVCGLLDADGGAMEAFFNQDFTMSNVIASSNRACM
jgi:hypothetical protein